MLGGKAQRGASVAEIVESVEQRSVSQSQCLLVQANQQYTAECRVTDIRHANAQLEEESNKVLR